MEFIDIMRIVHVFGAIVGMGGAFASDLMFFKSVRDGKITKTELGFLILGSRMVWTGFVILIASGLLLFFDDPDRFVASAKFLVKVTIVGVIFANGIFFHGYHLPRMKRHAGSYLSSSDEFMRTKPLLLASGAVSVVSWLSAFVLGMLDSIPYTYVQGVAGYGAILFVAICLALFMGRSIIPHHKDV